MDGVEETLISRPYQAQLEEIAVKKNTLIHLPTGSGKTFIAIRLIARFREATMKPWGQGGKRTFFLVNTVPLVNQHRMSILRQCPVKAVAGISGEDNCDYWDKAKWDAELSKYQVIVMTSQILHDMLTHSYIRIEDINLLIFDECHHAVDDHPMRAIMKQFEMCPVEKHPRVLGLTATLLNANVSVGKVQQTLKDLETTFHATIATVNELGEVLTYSTNPHEIILTYNPPNVTAAATKAIEILDELRETVVRVKLPRVDGSLMMKLKPWQRDITTDPLKIVKNVKNMIVSMVEFIEELGAYGGTLGIVAYHILLERLKKKAISQEETQLYNIAITTSCKAKKILLHSMEDDHGYHKIVKHSSQKVVMLLETLKEYNPATINSTRARFKVNLAAKPLSGIIFTKQRFTAKVLYNVLKDVKEANPVDFGFLRHDFIVGYNVNPAKSTREQHYVKKCSQTALLKFANKELNCLISTSVIEEGVDIPQCLLVLRYDPPLEYRSYIQSKGRARSADSSYVMLIDAENKAKFYKQYSGFQEVENYIQRLLIGSTYQRLAPSMALIQKNLYEEDDIPPYITTNGNRLSSVSAISLLNRYCSTLPHDQYTLITPIWIEESVHVPNKGELILVTIILPIASPVKEEIKGRPMHTLKSAKRSAALNACIKLHQVGELDPVSMLPKAPAKVDFLEPNVRECFPNWPWDSAEVEDELDTAPQNQGDEKKKKISHKAGTKKKIRKHKLMFPSYLRGVTHWENRRSFYLHIIDLKIAFKEPTKSREKALYDLLKREEGFGFITAEPLPKLCDFPSYLSVGEVTTSIRMNHAIIKLDNVSFNWIKQFHFFLFDQVLDIAKKFLCYDGAENAMYTVPIVADACGIGYDIDWTTITKYNEIRPVSDLPTMQERSSLVVNRENYRYTVVTPWYRDYLQCGRYIVSDVLEYMTPRSQFVSDAYSSFKDYYECKYNLHIVGDQDQPLLEVRNITSGMNCLMPRAATLNELTDKQQKLISQAQGDYKTQAFEEILVPEFCIQYDFPGVLWFKAMMLPSVFHRIYMLLVAHELRAKIATDIKYGVPHIIKGEEWEPIQGNRGTIIHSLLSQIEEPSTGSSFNRTNTSPEDSASPKKTLSMKETIYQLQKKKIAKEYPWDEKTEPIDIDRNISSVTVMDIECYEEFVSAPLIEVRSPQRVMSPRATLAAPALAAPPAKHVDQIELLSLKPLGRGPELRDILSSLTTINSHDTFDLERTETLGDSFLKYVASVYLFHQFPTLTEGQLTNIKSRLIGNRNLYYAGEKVRLGGRMKVEHFSPRKDFLLPGFFAPKRVQKFIEEKQIRPTALIGMEFPLSEKLSGCLSEKSWQKIWDRFSVIDSTVERELPDMIQNNMQAYMKVQAVSDKTVADCVESIVGTYLLSGGMSAAVQVLEWFGVLPAKHNTQQLLRKSVPTVISEKKAKVKDVEFAMDHSRNDVEDIMNYKFKDPAFLLEALSHPSFIRNRLTRSYERLEFIGDAILDFLITSYIFKNCSRMKPGDLTDLRSALVNNVTFASFAVKLGLHKYLCSQLNPALNRAILTFVEHQEEREHQIEEDVLYLIDESDCQIAEYVDVPKVLSDIFESLVGAIYLDSGGDLGTVWTVVYRIMSREIDQFSMRIPKQPVRVLYEMVHACARFGKPVVVDTDTNRVSIAVTFTKVGKQITTYGFGANKSQAKRAAAKLALKILDT